MEQRIVSQQANRYIYFIKDNNYSFYMLIPKSSKVSLVLNITDNVDDEKIKSMPLNLENVIVVPNINEQILSNIKQNNLEYFEFLNELFSKILNLSYQILTYNHLEVNNQIYFNESQTYTTFYNWFIQKHDGRVAPIKLENSQKKEIEKPNITNTNVLENNPPLEKKEEKIQTTLPTEEVSHGKEFGFVSYVLLGVVVAVISLVFLYLII